jgi:hypothetical protein
LARRIRPELSSTAASAGRRYRSRQRASGHQSYRKISSVRQFARPADDVFFGLLIEVLFPERKRIERMKRLREAVNAGYIK